jgi:hypothetical protein
MNNLEIMLELLHRFKAQGEWECSKGRHERCKYCQMEKAKNVWKEWEIEDTEAEDIKYDSLLMWPPEELMEDLLQFLRV